MDLARDAEHCLQREGCIALAAWMAWRRSLLQSDARQRPAVHTLRIQ